MTVFLAGVAVGMAVSAFLATVALAGWQLRTDARREQLLAQRARRP